MSDVRHPTTRWMRTRRRARRGLTVLLAIWLPLSIAREAFDLVGRLWLPVAFDLFQILSCILGLFAVCKQRSVLVAAFSVTALVSAAYGVALVAWYANLLNGLDRTQPLLSAGLPFGYSFFLRHTPFCPSHFNLTLSRWEQDAGCLVPYYAVEVLQASLHTVLSISAFAMAVLAVFEARREADNGKSSTPHTTSTVDKVQPSFLHRGSALEEATRLAAEAPNGLRQGAKSQRKSANGTIAMPDSLNDLSSGYMNSSYESAAADRELAPSHNTNGHNDGDNRIDHQHQHHPHRKYAMLKESGRQNRHKMAAKREALVENQPDSGAYATGKLSPQEVERYSSAATVEMNGSARARTNNLPSSPPAAINPPLSDPPPPPLPFLDDLNKSHPYTAIVHKQRRPLSRRNEPPHPSAADDAPKSNQSGVYPFAKSASGGGSARIYAKNTSTGGGSGGNYSALGRSHQLRSSLGRLRQQEQVDDESPSSEYLFPNSSGDGGTAGGLRGPPGRHLPLGGIEAERHSSARHGSSSLEEYLVSRGNANLTQLISFDPKSSIPLKVQGHRNSSTTGSSDEETADANQPQLKEVPSHSHQGGEGSRIAPNFEMREDNTTCDSADEGSLPSTRAPVLHRHGPPYSPTENAIPTTAAPHPSALLRRRMPYDEREFQKSEIASSHYPSAENYEAGYCEYGLGLVRSPIAPADSCSHWARPSDSDVTHLRPASASGFRKSRTGAKCDSITSNYCVGGGEATERLHYDPEPRFESQTASSFTAFPSRPKSLFEAVNYSIYECVGNRPLASTAFPVRQDEPEHLVAGVSVASAVSLSKAAIPNPTTTFFDSSSVRDHSPSTNVHRQSNPYINYPTAPHTSHQIPPPTNFPIAQTPPLYCNDEGMLV